MCAHYTRCSFSGLNPATISGTGVATYRSNPHWKKTRSVKKKKSLDGRAPDYLSEKLCYLWNITNHMIKGSRLPYRLSIPRTNDMKRMLFYNAIKLWNNVSDNDAVRSS